MVNKSECSKKLKKIRDWTLATTKKEISTAKSYSKLWANYSSIKGQLTERSKQLASVNLILQKKVQNIEALKQLEKDREEELEQIREEIKIMKDKITIAVSNESQESEKNKNRKLKLLQLYVLKSVTKTYVNDSKFPHIIRGFTGNEGAVKLIPFEIDPELLTTGEVQDAIWANCYQCSGYAREWEHLFNEESEADCQMNGSRITLCE